MSVSPEEYAVRFIELPHKVRGMTVRDEDGFYNIYINSLLSAEMQLEAYRHEMAHLFGDDFSNGKPIDMCEMLAKKREAEDLK